MTDYLRKIFANLLNIIAGFIISLGFSPNLISIFGLIGNLFAAWLIASGNLFWGGLLVLLFGLFDAIDGSMARLKGGETKFGAFLDSISDRYSELAILFGILIYSINLGRTANYILVFLAAVGSVMVSYTRAKAQSIGLEAKVGLLSRVERYLVITPSLLFGRPEIGLWIIAILGNVTAVQRIWHIKNQLKVEE